MIFGRAFALLILLSGFASAQSSLKEFATSIREAGLDPEACFRVRDLKIRRPGLTIYLNEGLLIFAKPVNGRRYGAVFSGEVEGGDAEVIVVPPSKVERRALTAITESPTFDEHFKNAALLFGDDTAEKLIAEIREKAIPGIREDDGPSLASRYGDGFRAITGSFAVRLVEERLMADAGSSAVGLLLLSFANAQRGAADVVFDPLWTESLLIGAVSNDSEKRNFITWTHFRPKGMPGGDPFAGLHTTNVTIDGTLDNKLELSSKVKIELEAGELPTRVLPFFMTRRMRILSVTQAGKPLEFLQRDEAKLDGSNDESDTFLVMLPEVLQPKQRTTVEFTTQGKVIEETSDRVYFVRSRSSWYPHIAIDMAPHRIKMRFPSRWTLVVPGTELSRRTEGETTEIEREIKESVRMVGFNLGEFSLTTEKRPPLNVELYSDVKLKDETHQVRTLQTPTIGGRRPGQPMIIQSETIPVVPRRTQLIKEVADGLKFLEAAFGPPPLTTVSVSPIPGNFGQGFPGLIYLTSQAWLPLRQPMPGSLQTPEVQSELLTVHEAAHQWFGNQVYSVERSDEWLMEALASYSALMYVEKKHGKAALDRVLSQYRERLNARAEDGQSVESTGPLVWGMRLRMTKNSQAWQRITYEKGSLVLHMLRQRMGREKFSAMLKAMLERFRTKPFSTEDFRVLAAEFLPPSDPDRKLELFFEQWVYGTGIPKLTLTNRTVPGSRQLRLELTQAQVANDFAIHVPLEIKLADGKTLVKWLQTGPEPVELSLDLPSPIRSVQLDPGHWILRQ